MSSQPFAGCPRILVITDLTLAEGGTGIQEVLLKYLDELPTESMLLFVPRLPPDAPRPRIARYRSRVIEYRPARSTTPFGRSLTGRAMRRLATVIDRYLPIARIRDLPPPIAEFRPELILVCPNSAEGIIAAERLLGRQRVADTPPVVLYLMDDWALQGRLTVRSYRMERLHERLVHRSSGGIYISEELREKIIRRYELSALPSIVLPNSISEPPRQMTPARPGELLIAYAGSIWRMHFDAVLRTAQAVRLLREQGFPARLRLYTPETFWHAVPEWEQNGVEYGGFLSPKEVSHALSPATFLLVASAFDPEFAPITDSSLQTKVLHYLTVGRPLLAVGPSYAVCNKFVAKWHCGLAEQPNTPEELAQALLPYAKNPSRADELLRPDWNALSAEFGHDALLTRFRTFLQQIAASVGGAGRES